MYPLSRTIFLGALRQGCVWKIKNGLRSNSCNFRFMNVWRNYGGGWFIPGLFSVFRFRISFWRSRCGDRSGEFVYRMKLVSWKRISSRDKLASIKIKMSRTDIANEGISQLPWKEWRYCSQLNLIKFFQGKSQSFILKVDRRICLVSRRRSFVNVTELRNRGNPPGWY